MSDNKFASKTTSQQSSAKLNATVNQSSNGFVNPYNFIRLPKERKKSYGDKDKHTGYIEYTITTKTPVFIPNSSSEGAFRETDKNKPDKERHKSYDFFSYKQLEEKRFYENDYPIPIIPGSEIRGVVRSVYETLTDSCMSSLNESERPQNRLVAPDEVSKAKSKYSLKELVGRFAPCNESDEKEVCPACDLFGYISNAEVKDPNNTNKGKVSKLRFSDMEVVDKKKPLEYYIQSKNNGKVTLPPLGSPELKCVEFYLKKPAENATFWTYDCYFDKRGGQNSYKKEELAKDIKINGRKYYWHHKNFSKETIENYSRRDKLNKTIRPVVEGITFRGRVYFENISERQLSQIFWILNTGSLNDDICLKIGQAKPLGYGSISCNIESVIEREIKFENNKIEYKISDNKKSVYENKNYENVEFSEFVKAEFMEISKFGAITQTITYPIFDNQKTEKFGIVKWFNKNHENNVIKQELPSILEVTKPDKMLKFRPKGTTNSGTTVRENKQSSVIGKGIEKEYSKREYHKPESYGNQMAEAWARSQKKQKNNK